jgi:hypothetical protein
MYKVVPIHLEPWTFKNITKICRERRAGTGADLFRIDSISSLRLCNVRITFKIYVYPVLNDAHCSSESKADLLDEKIQ